MLQRRPLACNASRCRCFRLAVGELPIIMRISRWKSAYYAAKGASTPQELERWVDVLVGAFRGEGSNDELRDYDSKTLQSYY